MLLIALAVVIGSLSLVAFAECFFGRRQRQFPALRRRAANIGIWIVNLILAAFFLPGTRDSQLVLGSVAAGLVGGPLAGALSFGGSFILLDLLHYLVHRSEHAVLFFWRLHALHHSDPDVDVTTSVRHHPIEYVFASAVYWVAVMVFDLPAVVVGIYTLTAFGMSAIQHGNIRLPELVEHWLQPVFVTTDLHRIHHSADAAESNSNYGAVFSIWDRLFGTFGRIDSDQQKKLVFGVRELLPMQSLTPIKMLLTPWLIAKANVGTA